MKVGTGAGENNRCFLIGIPCYHLPERVINLLYSYLASLYLASVFIKIKHIGMKKFSTAIFLLLTSFVFGQEQEICPGTVPAGWVIVNTRSCAGCCGYTGTIINKLVIKRIDNLPAGTTLEICPQSTPAGWVVIDTRSCAGCCGYGGAIINKPVIKKIDNLPAGTVVTMCPGPVPEGWVTVNTQSCAGCCGYSGTIINKVQIKKL